MCRRKGQCGKVEVTDIPPRLNIQVSKCVYERREREREREGERQREGRGREGGREGERENDYALL